MDTVKQYTEADFMTIAQAGIWPPEYCSSIGLVPYIKRLGPDLVGVEIGTEKGESTYVLLSKCPNIKKLTTIDHYIPWNNWDGKVEKDVQDKMKEIAKVNLAEFGDRVELMVAKSIEASKAFVDGSLDFIYIDGDPLQLATSLDLTNWYPKVRSKGIISGHNFQFSSVFEAVMDFRKENKIGAALQKSTNGTYFWIKQ